MKNLKLGLIIAAGVIAVIFLGVFGVQSSQNKAFALEEQVNTAQSDIKVQEKRRVDLVYNLADCIKQYDKHEAETLTLNEASEYFGIGYKKLKMFVQEHSDEDFVLWNGNRALIKREQFEKYMDSQMNVI